MCWVPCCRAEPPDIALQVRLDVDIRDTDDQRRDGVMQAAFAAAEAIAQRRRCGLRTETVFAYPAATSEDKVR
jgi:metal-dependent amidase/aminoacylase/carboxypeptidase family protein